MRPYLLGLYEKSMPNELSIPEKLKASKKAGFDYLELSIDETDEKLQRLSWSKDEIKKIVDAMWKNEIPIKSICLSGHRRYPLGDIEHQEKSLDIMQKAINLASLLGVRIIQLAGYDVYYKTGNKKTMEVFLTNLEKCTDMAAREGIVLAFETMETAFMNTVEKALSTINYIGSPYLQIYPDIGNLTNAALLYDRDVLEDLRLGKNHISALHIKETKPDIYREVTYGEGHVKFEPMILLAMKMGVRMYVGEFWYTGQKDWLSTLQRNHDFLRSLFIY